MSEATDRLRRSLRGGASDEVLTDRELWRQAIVLAVVWGLLMLALDRFVLDPDGPLVATLLGLVVSVPLFAVLVVLLARRKQAHRS